MSGAGDFRTRLMLQAPTESPDGQGGVLFAYADVGKVWTRVTPLASREGVVADSDGATSRVRIDVRAPLAITRAHRFVDGLKIYRVVGFRDDGRVVSIDAECRMA